MSEADILVFTGYPREAIETRLSSMEGLIDALITDPFDETAPQTLALRGSDNQRLFTLTTLGQSRFAAYDRPIAGSDRAFDVMFDDQGEIWLAGIPGRDDFRRLQSILRANGADAISSQDGRPSRHAGGVPK
jgi:anaerobic ribonucleoside-triphosphate reductase activating protein